MDINTNKDQITLNAEQAGIMRRWFNLEYIWELPITIEISHSHPDFLIPVVLVVVLSTFVVIPTVPE